MVDSWQGVTVMAKNIAVVFTFKSIERLLREGGTSSWRLRRSNARVCEFAVCTRNARDARTEGPEPHQSAFMVGKVKDVVPSFDASYDVRRGDGVLIF